ncbi:MAG TPA: GTPase [Methylibium sp.]|uniref:GTPase n=1 Tax=Methylibium sp. TaxID=2067992 RepID=UPI002DBB00AE|nr:GTPase [Methylibium sp.]HEU4459625.1 GTPase [Methylibium sp.]
MKAAPSPGDAAVVALSLIAHTNVGKTSLARTLLQRDVGEVRDEAHVTQEAERHLMIEAREAEPHARLELWDTPGFGDSVRLARRLAQLAGTSAPVAWFLSEVWDRFRDRGFWMTQRAVRNVVEQADVVLYLVDASQPPDELGYLDAELRVLELLRKPVLVLLNQRGAPGPADEEAAQVAAWRARTAQTRCVRDVLALDAFSRCWVHEERLLDRVAAALPEARRPCFARLQAAWRERDRARLRASIDVLAASLVRALLDREPLAEAGWSGRLREAGQALGLRRDEAATPNAIAMRALAGRLDRDLADATDRLIALHGLDGSAAREVGERLAEHFLQHAPMRLGKAAGWGGAATGALLGLKADLASGGLTLGGGLLVGALLGALGGAGLATAVNRVRGVERPSLEWSESAIDGLVETLATSYLAVAHHGRGRGAWFAGDEPGHWRETIRRERDAAIGALHEAMRQLRDKRSGPPDAAAISAWLLRLVERTLATLYPDAPTRAS